MADIDVNFIVDGVDDGDKIVEIGFQDSQTCYQKLTVRHYDNNTSSNPSQKSEKGALPANSPYEK